MNKKQISINPQYLNYCSSGKKKNMNENQNNNNNISLKNSQDINTNAKNIKDLLLKKLKEYKRKKKRKKHSLSFTNNFNSDFIEKLKRKDTEKYVLLDDFSQNSNDISLNIPSKPNPINNYYSQDNNNLNDYNKYNYSNELTPKKIEEPIYGNLKNGKKLTYRQTLKKKIKTHTEKKYILGKNKTSKKIGIFIKNNISRRNIEKDKLNLKNTKIKTVKNYLKKNNLIKYGSTAPNNLLREIYVNSVLCGDINNINGDTLIHNYYKDDEEEYENK